MRLCGNGDTVPHRHREPVPLTALADGGILVGDWRTGKIYKLSATRRQSALARTPSAFGRDEQPAVRALESSVPRCGTRKRLRIERFLAVRANDVILVTGRSVRHRPSVPSRLLPTAPEHAR